MEKDLMEQIKQSSPVVYEILKQQEETKWEITSGNKYSTVKDTHIISNDVCQLGVKF